MALLRFVGMVLAIVSTACTLTLDPNDLHADAKAGDDVTTTTGTDGVNDSTSGSDSDANLPEVELAYPGGIAESCKLYFAIPVPETGCAVPCPALSTGWDLVFDVANRPDLKDADITWRFSIDTPSDSQLSVKSETRTLEGRRVTTHIDLESCAGQPADALLTVETLIGGGGFVEQEPLTLDMQSTTCSTVGADCPAPE